METINVQKIVWKSKFQKTDGCR